MTDALQIAWQRSAAARATLARAVFWAAGLTFLIAAAVQLYASLPAGFWAELWAPVRPVHRAFATHFFGLLLTPVGAGLVAVALIGLARDRLMVQELRFYFLQAPGAAVGPANRWLVRRCRLALALGWGSCALIALASLGLDIQFDAPGVTNPVMVLPPCVMLSFLGGKAVCEFYEPLGEGLPLANLSRTPYEQGYLYGRFQDAPAPPELTAAYSQDQKAHFQEGAAAGQRMRGVLRDKGHDVNRR